MTAILFNLLANSAFSLAAGVLVIGLILWFFRVENDRWKLFLLSLPFCKVIYDLARGIPEDSILRTGLDPYLLPPHSQMLSVGLGISPWGPQFETIFSVQAPDGHVYASSLGDYLFLWFKHRGFETTSEILLCAVLALSAFFVARRIFETVMFERMRRHDRQTSGFLLSTHALRFRQIEIYLSDHFRGTPFTGGLLRPYICIPRETYLRLTNEEIQAVIAHEVAHVRAWDLTKTTLVQLLGDALWFIPGYRSLSRRIDALREIVADQNAVKSGAHPAHLASALLQLGTLPESLYQKSLTSAFLRKRSLLKQRIEHLVMETTLRPSRFGWKRPGLRVLVLLMAFAAVLLTTLGGNQSTSRVRSPDPIAQLLNAFNVR